jgi:hypothetical protein
MRCASMAALAAAAMLLAACETSNHAVFVTTTSLGFNFDTAPATASIAYDRTEGFLGPSYDNGGVPPVIATIETDGNVIAPKIRQLYGTGAAAVIAAGGTAQGPADLTGARHMAFIGTSTTLGLKAVFGADAGLSSFNLGFKRKEFSDLWLGSVNGHDVYPSVLASVDMTIMSDTPQNVGLKMRQFISTGPAAEALAKGDAGKFVAAAATNAAAEAAGAALVDQQSKHLDNVVAFVSPGGTWDPAKLGALVDKVAGLKPENAAVLKSSKSAEELRGHVGANFKLAADLDAASKS